MRETGLVPMTNPPRHRPWLCVRAVSPELSQGTGTCTQSADSRGTITDTQTGLRRYSASQTHPGVSIVTPQESLEH